LGKKDENLSDVAVNCLLLREPHLKPLTGSLDKYRQQLHDVYLQMMGEAFCDVQVQGIYA
jgi:hypothetical protein